MDTGSYYTGCFIKYCGGINIMADTFEDFIWEVRRNKAKLLEMYGGIEGLHKHMAEDRPHLEKEGWRFETPEESAARKQRHRQESILQ
jgi:hypothetical protein